MIDLLWYLEGEHSTSQDTAASRPALGLRCQDILVTLEDLEGSILFEIWRWNYGNIAFYDYIQ
jgi:hypothetical protein